MKVPEAVTHEHYSHRLRYHHSKRKREGKRGKRSRSQELTHDSLKLIAFRKGQEQKSQNKELL